MKFGIHSEQYQNNYSKEEEQKFTQVFGDLTSEFAAKMAEGVHASDESVQELVKQHYDFVLQFWTPNKEAYKSLAMTYILPSQYRDSYEEIAKGLGKYHYDAVCIWADKNLWSIVIVSKSLWANMWDKVDFKRDSKASGL